MYFYINQKQMKTIIITASLLFIGSILNGQYLGNFNELARTARFNKIIEEVNNGKAILKYSDIQGNPFYKSGFSNAKIGDTDNILPVRYNLYKDSFEVSNNNDIYSIPIDNAFSKFTFLANNEKFILANDEAGVSGYFLVVSEGINKLLKKLSVKYSPEVPAPNTLISGTPARFDVQKPVYYIKTEDNMIRLTKKADDLLNALPADKKDSVKDFIKTNKIKLTEELDLIKLVTFLNK